MKIQNDGAVMACSFRKLADASEESGRALTAFGQAAEQTKQHMLADLTPEQRSHADSLMAEGMAAFDAIEHARHNPVIRRRPLSDRIHDRFTS